MPDEKIDRKRPVDADNEPRTTQQRNVDDTVDDSFPASDPPAWTTTGAKSVAARCADEDSPDRDERPPQHGRSSQESIRQFAKQASSVARDIYGRGEHFSRQGAHAVAQPVQAHPLAAALAALAVGFALGWLVHGNTRSTMSPQWRRRRDVRRQDQLWHPTPPVEVPPGRVSARSYAGASSPASNIF